VGLLVGDYETVRSRGEQALTIWKGLGDEQGIGRAIHHLAEGARLEGEYERAGALYNESLAIHRRLKDEYVIAGEYQNLAYVEKHKGDFARAAELFRESLKITRTAGPQGDSLPRRGPRGRGGRPRRLRACREAPECRRPLLRGERSGHRPRRSARI